MHTPAQDASVPFSQRPNSGVAAPVHAPSTGQTSSVDQQNPQWGSQHHGDSIPPPLPPLQQLMYSCSQAPPPPSVARPEEFWPPPPPPPPPPPADDFQSCAPPMNFPQEGSVGSTLQSQARYAWDNHPQWGGQYEQHCSLSSSIAETQATGGVCGSINAHKWGGALPPYDLAGFPHSQWENGDMAYPAMAGNNWNVVANPTQVNGYSMPCWADGSLIQDQSSFVDVSHWVAPVTQLTGPVPHQWPHHAAMNSDPGNGGSGTMHSPPLPPRKPVAVVEVSTLLGKMVQHGRSKKVVVLLRGLPGSGKSEVARRLRAMSISKGLDAPRIHSIDDYFMSEVEKAVSDDPSGRKLKQRKTLELQYCHEPELEGTYQQNLVKAFMRTIDEGRFSFVIMDAPNVRIADFRDCMLAGQRAGYEVYVLQPLETDPKVCHERSVHKRSLDDIQKLKDVWEETPSVLPILDASPLFEDQSKQSAGICDVEMEPVESESDHDTSPSAKEAKRKSWASSQSRDTDLRNPILSKWEVEDESSNKILMPVTEESKESSDLKEVIKRANRRRVRWADEEEDEEDGNGFHIQRGERKLEEVFYVSDLGPEAKNTNMSDGTSRKPMTFSDLVKAERLAFKLKHLKCALKGPKGD